MRAMNRDRDLQLTNGTVYSKSARYDDQGHALTDDELMAEAPSVFAYEAHESRSARFAPIPTIEVLRALAAEGFHAVGAKQAVSRTEGRAPFTKHLIRLRRLDGQQRRVGDTVFEMLLKNANDGTAAYHLMGGLWRIECMNSLVTQTKTLAGVTVRHTSTAVKDVIEASYRVLAESDATLAFADQWSRIPLSEPERLAFAKKAHKLKFEGKTYGVGTALTPARLLETRRAADGGKDLWTTFNVVQENIIRGGQEGIGRDSINREARYRSRPIVGIDKDVAMNKALFGFAEAVAARKKVLVPG